MHFKNQTQNLKQPFQIIITTKEIKMNESINQNTNLGEVTTENIGKLKATTEALKKINDSKCEKSPEETAHWIKVIGKAILSLLP